MISGTKERVQENKETPGFEFSLVVGNFFIVKLQLGKNFYFSLISSTQVFTEILKDTCISNFHVL